MCVCVRVRVRVRVCVRVCVIQQLITEPEKKYDKQRVGLLR